MPVLLIRLAAPMQSWGSSSRFTRRETEPWPTKSGVIGMVAAALGIRRDESLARFAGLRFGVRVDQPGTLMSDYHTASAEDGDMMPLSRRYYLQDAVFLAGLERDDRAELEAYQRALAAPHYPLFLGRRSCPPDGPVGTMIVDGTLEDALRQAPWCASERYQRQVLSKNHHLEIVVEPAAGTPADAGFVDELADEPVSFDRRRRVWAPRRVMRLPGGASPEAVVREGAPDPDVSDDDALGEAYSAFDDDAILGAIVDAAIETEEAS